MSKKELLDQIAVMIDKQFINLHKRFDTLEKYHQQMLQKDKELLEAQNRISEKMATKTDMQELGKKIDAYIEIITIYRMKQTELHMKIEAILEYLGINNN